MTPHRLFICVVGVVALCGCGKEQQPPDNNAASKPEAVKPSQEQLVVPTSRNASPIPTATDMVKTLRQSVASRLAPITGNGNGPLSKQQWASIKQAYWAATFDRPVNLGPKGRVDQSLPSTKLKTPLCLQLASGVFDGVNDGKEQEALTAFYLVAVRDAMHGGRSLPNAFAERLSDPGTSYGDLLLFEIFDDALNDAVKSRTMEADETVAWNEMAAAANPACRLLALKSFRRVAIDQAQWLQFYAQYRNERSPDIIEALVQQLFESAHPDAISMLGELENNTAVKASPELAARVAQTKADMISVVTPPSSKQ